MPRRAKADPWGEEVYRRDQWICQYCGVDGRAQFAAWMSLSWDHLLPENHEHRDEPQYIVSACAHCNSMLSKYFEQAKKEDYTGDLCRDELVERRRRYMAESMQTYFSYWLANVAPNAPFLHTK